jgi:hypothetical protein
VVCEGGTHCCCDDGDVKSEGAVVADEGGVLNTGGVVGKTPLGGIAEAPP